LLAEIRRKRDIQTTEAGSVLVRVLEQLIGCGFVYWPLCFHVAVTTLVNLVTLTHVLLSLSSIIWYWTKGGDALQHTVRLRKQ